MNVLLKALAIAILTPSLAWAQAGNADKGKIVYDKRCSQCHGDTGAADGPGAETMLPRPRIFKENIAYKFRSTPTGALPTDQDLYRVIMEGITGSSMPGFPILKEAEIWDVIAYIKTLAEDFTDAELLAESIPIPELAGPATPSSPEAIARGKEVYTKQKCSECHGLQGRGNGTGWEALKDLKDDWGNPILPRNLTNREIYRNGSSAEDIFRTVTTGLNGTPMKAYATETTSAERWDLVHYVRSLGPADKETRDENIVAARVDTLPSTAEDEAWALAVPARFQLLPNIVEPPRLFWSSVEFVTIQALYSSDEIALKISWDDRTQPNGANLEGNYADPTAAGFASSKSKANAIYKETDHPDQFAVQFPAKRKDFASRPYFLMGDKKRATNLWWWSSSKADVIRDRNAKGFMQIKDQSEKDQALKGSATWADGRYTMVVRRKLATGGKGDTEFVPGTFTPIAFNAWDGNRGEVGNRRAVSTWYWLYLRPPTPDKVYSYPPFAALLTLGLLLFLIRTVRRSQGMIGHEEEPAEASEA
jgi:mono/diheme cytochrome c family protein